MFYKRVQIECAACYMSSVSALCVMTCSAYSHRAHAQHEQLGGTSLPAAVQPLQRSPAPEPQRCNHGDQGAALLLAMAGGLFWLTALATGSGGHDDPKGTRLGPPTSGAGPLPPRSPERTTTAGGALPTGSTSASNRQGGAGGRIPPQSGVNQPPAQQPSQTTWPQDTHPTPQQHLWQSGDIYPHPQQAPTQPQQPTQHAARSQPMAPTHQWQTFDTGVLTPHPLQEGPASGHHPSRTATPSKPAGNTASTTAAT